MDLRSRDGAGLGSRLASSPGSFRSLTRKQEPIDHAPSVLLTRGPSPSLPALPVHVYIYNSTPTRARPYPKIHKYADIPQYLFC